MNYTDEMCEVGPCTYDVCQLLGMSHEWRDDQSSAMTG